MANWIYRAEDYQERDFAIIPEGNHRVRIMDVVEKVFKSGNEGFEITLEVSGQAGKLWHSLVLDRSNEQRTNQNIGAFFNCFGITTTQLGSGQQWVGKVGAVRVKHNLYNGSISASVAFCLSRSQQKKFPNFGGYSSAKQGDSQTQDRPPVAEKNRFPGFGPSGTNSVSIPDNFNF